MSVFHTATSSEIHEALFCSHKILYQPGISVVKHCAKSSISCITGSPSGNTTVWLISISKLKAHGMMSGAGFEVVHIQMGTENKINNNTWRQRVCHVVAHNKNTHLKMWSPAVCTQASLPHKHTFQGHSFDPSACYLIWLSYENIFFLLIFIIPPTQCCHLPPPPSTTPLNPVGFNWSGVLHDRERLLGAGWSVLAG